MIIQRKAKDQTRQSCHRLKTGPPQTPAFAVQNGRWFLLFPLEQRLFFSFTIQPLGWTCLCPEKEEDANTSYVKMSGSILPLPVAPTA